MHYIVLVSLKVTDVGLVISRKQFPFSQHMSFCTQKLDIVGVVVF